MPSCRPSTIPYVVSVVRQISPESILDVGVGFGKWGYIFREYTDIIRSERDPQRYHKSGWKVRVDGIEGYAAYLHEAHRFIYDEVFIGDALEILPRSEAYDLIFLGDIIEHFELSDGVKLLTTALSKARKCVIVTTPKFETGQKSSCDNLLETHRSLWGPKLFNSIGPCQIRMADRATYVVVYSKPGIKRIKLDLEKGQPDPIWWCRIKDFFTSINFFKKKKHRHAS